MGSTVRQIVIGQGLAIALGWAGQELQVPLAWVLGPMLAAAALSLGGVRTYAPTPLRRLGQIIIGATIGLNMTAPVVRELVDWLPWMAMTAVLSVLFSAIASVAFARLGRIDGKTAYFALLPGGLAEMATLGASIGARSEPVAVAHAVRVAVVVCLLPPLILSLGLAGDSSAGLAARPTSLEWVPVLLGLGTLGAVACRMLRLHNPWMFGALVAVAAATAAGLLPVGMPKPVFFAGQFLLGFAIGTRFRREIIGRLPRLAGLSVAFTLLLSAIMAIYAIGLSRATDIDAASAILAAATGGASEMAVTAQALHLNAALVAAFHVFRNALVNLFALQFWTALSALGLFGLLRKLFGENPADHEAAD